MNNSQKQASILKKYIDLEHNRPGSEQAKASLPAKTEKEVLLYRNNSLAVVAKSPPKGRFATSKMEINDSEQIGRNNDNIFENLDSVSLGKRSQSLEKFID